MDNREKERESKRTVAADGTVELDGETFGDAVSRWDQEGLDASEFPDARLWDPPQDDPET